MDGGGIEKLEQAGINVNIGILENECFEINKGFFNWIINSRPWVIAKVAQTKDGFMGMNSESTVWISGNDTFKYTHKLA